jgi:hypothetical protein
MNSLVDPDLRAIVRAGAESYLDPEFDQDDPLDFAALAEAELISLQGYDLLKVQRYALAAAASHILISEAVSGEGVEARFVESSDEPYSEESPLNSLQEGVYEALFVTSDHLVDENDRFAYLLDEYDALTHEVKALPGKHKALDRRLIMTGGVLAIDGSSFVGLTANLMAANPLTKGLEAVSRAAIAHTLLPIATAKASKHLYLSRYAPS